MYLNVYRATSMCLVESARFNIQASLRDTQSVKKKTYAHGAQCKSSVTLEM